MKKIFYSLFAISMAIFSLTGCEDVPEPYNMPEKPGTGGDQGGGGQLEGTGAGTLLDPFDCIAAINYATALGADVESTEDVYIKGKVVSITEEYTTNYGNASFDISNDGENKNTFKVWRALYLGNKKYTSDKTQIKVGDEVIICGKVINYYGNTPETVQGKAYLYSLNGVTEEGGSEGDNEGDFGEQKGSGTVDDPYNCAAALAFTSALGKDEKSEKEIYIKGIVSNIKYEYDTNYGNGTFSISDDGTSKNEFLVWRALYLGNVKYTAGQEQPHVGDEVIICGKVVNYYGNTPETVQGEAYLYSLKCNYTGGGDEPGGGDDNPGGEVSGNSLSVTFADFGWENQTALEVVTLTDGTTLSFDAGGNNNGPKYYTTGNAVRMYPKNSVVINSSKKIASIKITCDNYNGTLYNASGDISSNPGSVSISGDDLLISGINASKVTLTNVSSTTGAPSQLRAKSIVITYAE